MSRAKILLSVLGMFAVVALAGIGMNVAHPSHATAQTAGAPTVSLGITDGDNNDDTITAPAGGAWSRWAVIPAGFRNYIAGLRISGTPAESNAPFQEDFRIHYQLATTVKTSCDTPGIETMTGWASENTYNLDKQTASFPGGGVNNCIRISIETRPVPANTILSNAYLRVAGSKSCSYTAGELAQTPALFDTNGARAGGWSSWTRTADDNNPNVNCVLMDILSTTQAPAFSGDISVYALTQILDTTTGYSSDFPLVSTWTVTHSDGSLVGQASTPTFSGHYNNLPADTYSVQAAPTVTYNGATYTLTNIWPSDHQILGPGPAVCAAGQNNPHLEPNSDGTAGCSFVNTCGTNNCRPDREPIPRQAFGGKAVQWLMHLAQSLHILKTSAAGTPTPTTSAQPDLNFYLFYAPGTGSSQTLSVSLATPGFGSGAVAPQTGKLTATVGGSAAGTINYYFWPSCTSGATTLAGMKADCGNPSSTFSNVSTNPQQSSLLTWGHYSIACVLVERGTKSATDCKPVILGTSGTVKGQHLSNVAGTCNVYGWSYYDLGSSAQTDSVAIYATGPDGIRKKVDTVTANLLTGGTSGIPAQNCSTLGQKCGFVSSLTGKVQIGVNYSIEAIGVRPDGTEQAGTLSGTPIGLKCGDTQNLYCAPTNPASGLVGTNQNITFSGRIQGGSPSWSALDSDATVISGANGTDFTLKYAAGGQKTVRLTVGSASTTCTAVVSAGGGNPGGGLNCSASQTDVAVNQPATFTGANGTEPYNWNAPGCDAQSCNFTGNPFAPSYATPGFKSVTVADSASPAANASCGVTVTTGMGSITVISDIPTTWTLTGNSPQQQTTPAGLSPGVTYPNEAQGGYTLTPGDEPCMTENITEGPSQFLNASQSITFHITHAPGACNGPTLTVQPPTQTTTVGGRAYGTALYDADGTGPGVPQNVTQTASWKSLSPGILAFLSTDQLYGAQFYGLAQGVGKIQASYLGLTATGDVTVNQPQQPQGPFYCNVVPPFRYTTRGTQVTFQVNPQSTGIPGFKWFDLTVANLPQGTTGSFAQDRVFTNTTTTLTLNVGATPDGVYTFDVNCHLEEAGWGPQDSDSATGLNVSGDSGPGATHLACLANTCAPVAGAGGNQDGCTSAGAVCNTSTACNFKASPTLIAAGGSSQLSWSCGGNVGSCTVKSDSGLTVGSGLSGPATVKPSKTTTYTLACSGGNTESATVKVGDIHEVPPR